MITETCRPRGGEFPQYGKLSALCHGKPSVMRKLSAPRTEALRPAHDNSPAPGNPPRPACQLSGTSTTTLRSRQPSATDTATLRDQHDNPPAHEKYPRALVPA